MMDGKEFTETLNLITPLIKKMDTLSEKDRLVIALWQECSWWHMVEVLKNSPDVDFEGTKRFVEELWRKTSEAVRNEDKDINT